MIVKYFLRCHSVTVKTLDINNIIKGFATLKLIYWSMFEFAFELMSLNVSVPHLDTLLYFMGHPLDMFNVCFQPYWNTPYIFNLTETSCFFLILFWDILFIFIPLLGHLVYYTYPYFSVYLLVSLSRNWMTGLKQKPYVNKIYMFFLLKSYFWVKPEFCEKFHQFSSLGLLESVATPWQLISIFALKHVFNLSFVYIVWLKSTCFWL